VFLFVINVGVDEWANLGVSLQLSDNPQLRVLPGCPPTRNFRDDPSGIAQFLKPYQDALAAKKLKTAEQARARLLQQQQMRAEKEKKEREEKEAKDEQERARLLQQQMREKKEKIERAKKEKKELEEKEAKDRKAKKHKLIEEKSSSTSTPMLLQILQGHVPPCCLYGDVRDVSR